MYERYLSNKESLGDKQFIVRTDARIQIGGAMQIENMRGMIEKQTSCFGGRGDI